jgi:hypothetical protein
MSDSNEAKKPWHHHSYGGMRESSAKASWEASRDRTERWIAAGRPAPPPVGDITGYQPTSSTIRAFWLVASFNDPDRLGAWLYDHPLEAPALIKSFEVV